MLSKHLKPGTQYMVTVSHFIDMLFDGTTNMLP